MAFKFQYICSKSSAMKKLLLVAIGCISIMSCSKLKKKHCWKCTTTVVTSPSYGTSAGTSSTTVCDKTEDEINDYQKSGTSTATGSYMGFTATTTTTTKCVQQ